MTKKRLGNVMRSWFALGSMAWPCSFTSCATVDPVPDFRQADEAMAKATGINAHWAELGDLKPLARESDGVVTLDTVAGLTLWNNRSLRADLQVIGQAKADWVQAGLLSNPMLGLAVGFPEGGGRAKLDFGLSKDLADLWLIPSRKHAAQGMLQQRVLSFANVAIVLLTEARANYRTLQYLFVASDLQQQNLRILQEAMEIAQARFRAGDTTQLDVNLVRARYIEAENELLQLRTDLRVTQRTILRLMGVSRDADDWQPQALPLDTVPPRLSATEADLIDVALLQRLDVQAARWEVEAAVAEFEQQKRRVIPSLNLGLAGERPERRALPGRDVLADTARASIAAGQLTAPEIQSASERNKERSQEIDLMLGPSIEVPLPIFDQNQAQIAKAQFRARELQHRYEEMEQRVTEAVRSAFIQRRFAEDRARLYRESLVPLQEANLELAQTAYQAGRESILTVLLAQESLIRTRLAYAAAVRDLSISAANLERQLGGPIRSAEQVIEP